MLRIVSQFSGRSLLLFLVALFNCASPGRAAAQEFPLFETRGVWFATVLRDGSWPVSTSDSAVKQEADLRDRIRHAASLGLNTFVFQAVARGDAMYRSTRLPWSARLRGAAQDPGYDPLAVAVDEAHKLGIELHAWINVNRVGDVSSVTDFQTATDPGHVYYEHSGWVQSVSGALWLDPSSTDARQWLVDNTMEIVSNYDVDAIHFDFIRYPQGGLPDDLANFQFDPRGFQDIGDWRRDNITEFVRDVSATVGAFHPWVKIGSTPFGNYQSFPGAWPAAWALTDVFQESRVWLAEGINDYLAPQIYFDIGRDPEPPNTYDSPDFEYLVSEWIANSSGRPIFVGLGPYKSVVFEELDQQIELTRTSEAAGQIHFRYDHIKNYDFAATYPGLALPAPMRHRFEAVAPSPPTDLVAMDQTAPNGNLTGIRLSWNASFGSSSDPLRSYAIFRSRNSNPFDDTGENLIAVVWGDSTSYLDTPQDIQDLSYQVVAVSRLGILSLESNVAAVLPVSTEAGFADGAALRIESIHPNPSTDQLTVSFRAVAASSVEVVVYDLIGRQAMTTEYQAAANGTNQILLDVRNLSSGLYTITLRSSMGFVAETFVVSR